MKTYSIPSYLEQWIEQQLNALGTSLSHSQDLAQSIQKMADFYIEHPEGTTPWQESWCQKAQLAYYFPLNFLRNLRVFEHLHESDFFSDKNTWFEFGVGLGPSLEALSQVSPDFDKLQQLNLFESSNYPRALFQKRFELHGPRSIQWLSKPPRQLPPNSMLMFSYSMTELTELPSWCWTADAMVIVEPSTREDGRRLMSIRELALEKGFNIAAPCTHAEACPLLTQSKRDWCHDRMLFDRPQWMLEIEKHLPFRNATLTFSYLALSKKSVTFRKQRAGAARIVGDFLDEKGKSRQLICRNSNREFLTFIKKDHTPIEFARGDLLRIKDSIIKKGEDLRVDPVALDLENEDVEN